MSMNEILEVLILFVLAVGITLVQWKRGDELSPRDVFFLIGAVFALLCLFAAFLGVVLSGGWI